MFPNYNYNQNNASKSPGPSTYSPQYDKLRAHSASCTIGNSKRDIFKSRDVSPGPGLYNTNYGKFNIDKSPSCM